MKLVFCTTCKNRSFHLAETLPQNLAGNRRSSFVVLDYGSKDDVRSVVRPLLDSGRVALYSFPTAAPFHMTHAKNMAHRLGMLEGGDVLVNLDADNYLHDGFEDWAERHFEPQSFFWAGMIQGLGGKFRGVNGRLGVTPAAFIKTGGYDERFSTWSHDDKDFNQRLRHLGYRPKEIDRRYLESIPHGDGVRFREYPAARYGAGEDSEPAATRTAVVNAGAAGTGEVTRHDGLRLELGKMPTRIFGIGLHKTATTSLHAALQILGYESEHWGSNGWARDVWNEMKTFGFSPTLEKSYAASDLPISVLYRELDIAYPGSKFILTLRDESSWLRSVRDHFSYEKNPCRWEWDVYPFSNKIHRVVYGRTDYDQETMRAAYRRHTSEILSYFRNRSDDLLVMREPGWPQLCRFLGKPVPHVEYPRAHITNGD